ncbi:hypothetical protein H4I96_10199 [Botrytis cinerea]
MNNYSALSYVWGDANNRKTVSVEEKPLLVTASLDSALRHLQDRKKDVMIWADGICINPSDYEEKNTQVNLMALIYEVASHIIIFLGETTPEGDKIFELLLPQYHLSHDSDAFDLESKEDMESKIHDLIRHVLDMPWFRRIWILQELVLSVDPWHNSAWVKSPNYNVLADLCMLRESFASRTSESSDPCDYLLQILHSRRGYGVSDPRDMLYGHLAMFANLTKSKNPKIERLVEIDYRKTVADVYTDLTLYILNRQSDFGFLSHVEDVNFEERKGNLPTWVPDWTSNKVSTEAKWHLERMKTRNRLRDVSDIHVVVGEKAVLGCIGTRVDCVEVVKNEIPRRVDVFALCHKIRNRPRSGFFINISPPAHEVLPLLYEHFCAWLNTSEIPSYNYILKDLEKNL